jgi:hypothetical protein
MTRMNLSVVVLVSGALLLAGCGGGGSSSPGVAHLSSRASGGSAADGAGKSSASEGSRQQTMVAYARCMRTHGVPEFPEPSEGHLLIHSSDHNGHVTGLNPQSAQFQAAQKVCGKLLPNGGVPSPAEQSKMQEKALQFSKCMRTHGVPSFPDPKFGGAGKVSLRIGGGPSGINPRSSQFQAAQKACQSILPGPKSAGPGGGGPSTSSGGPGGGSTGQAVAIP